MVVLFLGSGPGPSGVTHGLALGVLASPRSIELDVRKLRQPGTRAFARRTWPFRRCRLPPFAPDTDILRPKGHRIL